MQPALYYGCLRKLLTQPTASLCQLSPFFCVQCFLPPRLGHGKITTPEPLTHLFTNCFQTLANNVGWWGQNPRVASVQFALTSFLLIASTTDTLKQVSGYKHAELLYTWLTCHGTLLSYVRSNGKDRSTYLFLCLLRQVLLYWSYLTRQAVKSAKRKLAWLRLLSRAASHAFKVVIHITCLTGVCQLLPLGPLCLSGVAGGDCR